MKRNILIPLLVVAALAIAAGLALAITTSTVPPGTIQSVNGEVLQNVQAIAPKQAGNVCVTKTIHNASNTIAVFNLYTSNRWYQKADWKVVNSATGADYVVQRKLGNNTSGTPGASGCLTVNREYTTYTLSPFGNNTSATLRVCQDRQ